MHQSLTALPRRVVIDTNVLLNASFLADGSSRYSLKQLNRLGFSLIVDQAIEDEATLVLRRLRIKLGLQYDPVAVFRAYLEQSRILSLPRAAPFSSKRINKADHHIIGAAAHYDAWVLTGDIKLSAQCQGLHIATRLPWDVIMEAATKDKRNPPLHYIVRVAGISATSGSFFARVLPGNWAGRVSMGRYTVCDIQNVGRIYYDTSTEEWVFSTTMGAETRLKCPLEPNQNWIVSASYELGTRDSSGTATLRAAQPFGQSFQNNISFKGKISAPTPGTITFGHAVNKSDHWTGYVRQIVLSPIPLDSKSWRALVRVPEAAPDPTASNILEAALSRVRIMSDGWLVPSQLTFGQFWI